MRNRLEIKVIRDSDSATTVTVGNIFKVTPLDLNRWEYETDQFAKAKQTQGR